MIVLDYDFVVMVHMLGAASDVPTTSAAAKPTELLAPQKSTRAVPKPPTSQSASVNADSTAPRTPAKGMSRSFGDRSIICLTI